MCRIQSTTQRVTPHTSRSAPRRPPSRGRAPAGCHQSHPGTASGARMCPGMTVGLQAVRRQPPRAPRTCHGVHARAVGAGRAARCGSGRAPVGSCPQVRHRTLAPSHNPRPAAQLWRPSLVQPLADVVCVICCCGCMCTSSGARTQVCEDELAQNGTDEHKARNADASKAHLDAI